MFSARDFLEKTLDEYEAEEMIHKLQKEFRKSVDMITEEELTEYLRDYKFEEDFEVDVEFDFRICENAEDVDLNF